MNNDELNHALLAFGEKHFGHHENVSVFFWDDIDGARRVRWLVTSKDSRSQGAGETLAAAREDYIQRRTTRIAELEAQIANLKAQ